MESSFTGKDLETYINNVRAANLESVTWTTYEEIESHIRYLSQKFDGVGGYIQQYLATPNEYGLKFDALLKSDSLESILKILKEYNLDSKDVVVLVKAYGPKPEKADES